MNQDDQLSDRTHDPRPESESNTKSLYDIPPGCICLGDGLMGMKCNATKHAQIRAMAFIDREKQTFSRYAELFPDYEWIDSATAIDLMAAEIKCLRSELLDACRLATSMREFAKPEYATTKPAEWENWKKLCARLTALLIEIRARWYGGVL